MGIATNSAVDINLTAIGNSVNSSITLAERVVGGVADQGELIGLAIGLTIALVLLFGVIFVVLQVIPRLISKLKGLKAA